MQTFKKKLSEFATANVRQAFHIIWAVWQNDNLSPHLETVGENSVFKTTNEAEAIQLYAEESRNSIEFPGDLCSLVIEFLNLHHPLIITC